MCCGSCSANGAATKCTTIIVVMPSSLPMACGQHAEPVEGTASYPMPIPPGVMLPHPLPILMPPGLMPPRMAALPPLPHPPCMACPMSSAPCAARCPIAGCLSSLLSMIGDLCCHARPLNVPSLCAPAMGLCLPAYAPVSPPFPLPRELASQEACSPLPAASGCVCAAPNSAAQLRIHAKPSGDQLEMNFEDGTRLRCKKMTVTIGEKEITLSRFDDRVRVRGEDLKATADCVCNDRKDHLVLQGDVVLHYKKDGHSAHINGDCIEVNLATGAVKIEPGAPSSQESAEYTDR